MAMEIGVGIDIENVERFKDMQNKQSLLIDRIFTEGELEGCFSGSIPSQYLATIFSAKEAVIKSLSSFDNRKFLPWDIEIIKDVNGKFSAKIPKYKNHCYGIEISLSYTSGLSMAVAVAYKLE